MRRWKGYDGKDQDSLLGIDCPDSLHDRGTMVGCSGGKQVRLLPASTLQPSLASVWQL
jgi:hypothetical protein